MKTPHVLLLVLLLSIGVRGDDVAPSGPAVPIPILNPSFESPVKSTVDNSTPTDWTTSDPAEYDGYTGYVRNSDQYATAPEGNQYLEITATDQANPVGFSYSQVTKFVAEPGDRFILHVATAGMSVNKPPAGNFALTLDASPVAYNSDPGTAIASTTPDTVFYDQTVTYTVTDPALAGATVGVSLMTPYGSQDVYDNVRLEVIKGPSTASRTAERPVATKDRKGFRVFSCGHSYHFLNYNLPILLREVARDGGYPDHEIVGQSVIFGSKALWHWNVKDEDNKAKAALIAGDVDVLTLTMVYLPDDGIEKFAQLGLEHNPNIRVMLQENWLPFDANNPHHFDPPTEPRPATVDHNAATVESLKTMHEPYWKGVDDLVTDINQKLGKQVVFVVPTGQAVVALRGKVIAGQAPGIKTQEDLFSDMLGHPKGAIQALTAYCEYAVIYKTSPVGLPITNALKLSNIPPENQDALNHLLQELAWDAVTHHPLSGVAP